jgi:hypothetical protein
MGVRVVQRNLRLSGLFTITLEFTDEKQEPLLHRRTARGRAED